MKYSKWFYGLVALLVMMMPVVLLGQDAPFPDDGGAGCDGPFGAVCPIDGGVSFLIAAGVALGGKKAYDLRNKN